MSNILNAMLDDIASCGFTWLSQDASGTAYKYDTYIYVSGRVVWADGRIEDYSTPGLACVEVLNSYGYTCHA